MKIPEFEIKFRDLFIGFLILWLLAISIFIYKNYVIPVNQINQNSQGINAISNILIQKGIIEIPQQQKMKPKQEEKNEK